MSDRLINLQFSNFKGLYSQDEAALVPSNPDTGVFAQEIENATCLDGTITFDAGYEEENDGASLATHQNGSDDTYIRNEWLLKRRDGVKINVAYLNNGKIEWKNTVLNRYETLLTGLTAGLELGMQEFNKTSQDRVYFGNGTENLSFWSKAVAYYASDNGVDQITVTVPNSAHTTLIQAGFAASGTIVYKNGTTATYTGTSGLTFTGVSALPASPVVGDGIADAPDTSTLSGAPKGSIMFVYQGRLGIVLEASPTVIKLSVVADGTDFATGGVSGTVTINCIDGDGRIWDVKPFDKKIYVYKEDGIIPVQIIQIEAATLRTNIEPLVLYPDVGPDSYGRVFAGVDEVYHLSAENDIKRLTTILAEEGTTNRVKPITADIQKTMDNFSIDAGKIYFSDRRLLATLKSSDQVSQNDTLLDYDFDRDTFYFHRIAGYAFWKDSSGQLHITSPTQVKSYRLFSGLDADGGDLSYLWKSGRLNMGSNFYKKETNLFAIFGRMTSASTLHCKLDYNNGALLSHEWDIEGDGSSIPGGRYILDVAGGGSYGENPYGIEGYGGVPVEDAGMQYFLFFKSLPKAFNPYDVVVSFSAQGSSNKIRIISFGMNPKMRSEVSKYRRA